MKCPSCGNEVPDNAPACSTCDAPLDRTVFTPNDRADTIRLDAPPEAARSAVMKKLGEKEVHARFLLSPVLAAPILLEEGNFYRIGRDRAGEVYFPSTHVSRLHAEVSLEKKQWTISDLGSRNGTLVNGDRVLKRALRHGDKISIGQFDLTFFEATKEEALDLLERSKKRGWADTARVVHDTGEFYGDIHKLAPLEIVQLLGHNRKTGCLTLMEAGSPAERKLWFLEGEIVHAEFGSVEGVRAVQPALRVREGKFAFKPASAIAKVTITTPTSALLLQSM